MCRGWPDEVMIVDGKGVAVPDRCMPVRMAMRLGPLPAFMVMPVVFVVDMHRIMGKGGMLMLDLDRIVGWPKHCRSDSTAQAYHRPVSYTHLTLPTKA